MQIFPKTTSVETNQSTPPDSLREIITLDVSGMRCAGCVKAVENQLTQHPGVLSASVNFATEVARVECQAGHVNAGELANRLTATGFPAQPRYSQPSEGAGLSSTPSQRHQKQIRQQIFALVGAGILILLSGTAHLGDMGWGGLSFPSNIWFHWGLATAALLGPGRTICVEGWLALWRRSPTMNTLVGLGAISSYLASCVAALFPSLQWECFFDEPVMLLGFILLGRTLEQMARRRAAFALESLIALQPPSARLIANPDKNSSAQTGPQALLLQAQSLEIPADHVRLGEWLQVLPGEKIPVDGEVVAGNTTADESMLTGEAMPVFKQPGSPVTAGTLNQSGTIIIRATRTGPDTTLAQIVALVEEAQTRKAPVQQLADTVAGYFTYGVMTLALLTFLFWELAGTRLWPEVLNPVMQMSAGHPHLVSTHYSPLLLSLKLAIAVLVIACPCALGLATPTALLVGTATGAERGLLIRGGDVLEKIDSLDTVVFDKTGTLTTGEPVVTDCVPIVEAFEFLISHSPLIEKLKLTIDKTPVSSDFSLLLLQLAATVESGTTHPLGRAILREAQQRSQPLLAATNFYTEAGLGVWTQIQGEMVLLGRPEWLAQQGVAITDGDQQLGKALASEGKTVVYVALRDRLLGVLACSDELRPDAQSTCDWLRQELGLRVMLLTGDRPEAAYAIAGKLGLSPGDVLAGVRPEGKAAAIASLQERGYRVAMVGDGINDAPALAQADVGIALRSGTGVAVETAGIVLMRDRLSGVVESVQLSRNTLVKIRQNLFWAFAYNALGLPVAAGVLLPTFGILLNPAVAGSLMAFSSLSVVANSLFLRSMATRNRYPLPG